MSDLIIFQISVIGEDKCRGQPATEEDAQQHNAVIPEKCHENLVNYLKTQTRNKLFLQDLPNKHVKMPRKTKSEFNKKKEKTVFLNEHESLAACY